MQYVVLKPISPPEGAIIEPAQPDTEPVLVDAALFSGDTEDERAANIERLIEAGVIAPFEAPAPADPIVLEAPVLPRRVARQPEE